MTIASELVNVTAVTANPGRLAIALKDRARPVHVRINHPGVAEYQLASGGPLVSGDQGYFLDADRGRDTLTLDLGGDARFQIQVKEAGKKEGWLNLDGWQEVVSATRLTGNPATVRIF